MKNNKKYLLTEVALVLFHIFISLIIFLIPLCVNEMMNGRIAFTAEVIVFIIALMFLEIILQLVYTVMEQHLMKNCKISMSKEIYHKIFSMKYSSLIRYGATYLVGRADSAVLTFSNPFNPVGSRAGFGVCHYRADSGLFPVNQRGHVSSDGFYPCPECCRVLFPQQEPVKKDGGNAADYSKGAQGHLSGRRADRLYQAE